MKCYNCKRKFDGRKSKITITYHDKTITVCGVDCANKHIDIIKIYNKTYG